MNCNLFNYFLFNCFCQINFNSRGVFFGFRKGNTNVNIKYFSLLKEKIVRQLFVILNCIQTTKLALKLRTCVFKIMNRLLQIFHKLLYSYHYLCNLEWDLRISVLEKHKGIIRIKQFYTEKGHLKLCLQFLWVLNNHTNFVFN